MAEILAAEHPNEAEVVFKISATLPLDQCHVFSSADAARDNSLARALFFIMGVKQVLIETKQITLTRDTEIIWPLIIPPAINILSSRIRKLDMEVA